MEAISDDLDCVASLFSCGLSSKTSKHRRVKTWLLFFAFLGPLATAADSNGPQCAEGLIRSQKNSLDFRAYQIAQKDAVPGQVSAGYVADSSTADEDLFVAPC